MKCFLHSESFVWTSKDVAVVKIEQDETWDANIPVLKEFYFKHIFPKIVEGALLNFNSLTDMHVRLFT